MMIKYVNADSDNSNVSDKEMSDRIDKIRSELKALKMTVTDFLNNFDFDYEVDLDESGYPCWKLIDLQDAYLGSIGEDEFNSIGSIVDRLDIYYDDYLFDGEWIGDFEAEFNEIVKDNPRDWRIPYLYYILHPNELIIDKPLSK
jgi:hypothetical protein